MADEITITISGSLVNGLLKRTYAPGAAQVDQAAKKRSGHSQDLTTSWEAVDLEDVTTGFVFLTNLDATNAVEFGPLEAGSGGDGLSFGILAAGDPPACFHLKTGVTLMVKAAAATATVDVECWSI